MELIESVTGTEVTCRVVQGGRLTDVKVSTFQMLKFRRHHSRKNRADASFILAQGVDFSPVIRSPS